MTSYSVQEAYDGIMKTERGFDTYGEAFRFFKALCRGTGRKTKDVWLVQYDEDDQEGYELAHKEIKGEGV